MKILHIGPVNPKRHSGLSVSIPGLVAAQDSLDGITASLMVTRHSLESNEWPFVAVEYDKRTFCASFVIGNALVRDMDLVVFHSTYIAEHAEIARVLRRMNIPYIIVPRGGFTDYARSVKKVKKRIGEIIKFSRFFRGALAIQFLTDGERKSSTTWNRPAFVVGNGIHIPSATARPGTTDSLRFVYIGRLDIQTKGLDLLLASCALCRSLLAKSKTTVHVYGPDHAGAKRQLALMIRKYGLEETVYIHRPVRDEEKTAILRETDVFVHTSRSEGHPMAVLEALSYGIPCLVTPETNVGEEIRKYGAGWVVEGTPHAIANAITSIHEAKDSLSSMGVAARRLAIAEYDWRVVAERCVHQYNEHLLRHARNR